MMKNLFILAALAFSATAFCQNDTTYKPVETPAGYTRQIDVVYTRVDGWDGRMDLYLPPNNGKPTPIVLNIHGGGWNHGVKESQTSFKTFFKMGYAVGNIEYRLTPQATAPAAVEDVRCALLYVIKNAGALNIDVNKIVVMGASAGGHLALMAGLLGNDHRFDKNCAEVNDVKVAAIIDQYGIVDVWDWGYGKNVTSKSAVRWLGKYAQDEKFARSVSPIYYVTKNSPPVFITHGDVDPTVPYQHSVNLKTKLDEMGVKNEFITVSGGLHGKFSSEEKKKIAQAITSFLTNLGIR